MLKRKRLLSESLYIVQVLNNLCDFSTNELSELLIIFTFILEAIKDASWSRVFDEWSAETVRQIIMIKFFLLQRSLKSLS